MLLCEVYAQGSEVHCEGQAGREEGEQHGGKGNCREGNDPNEHARDSSGHGEQNIA